MARPYHIQNDLVPARLPLDELVQLTQDERGSAEVATSVYEAARDDADSEIDGYLGERYAVPLDEVPALVRRISMTLTVCFLYSRRYPGQVPESVQAEGERTRKLLRNIADGQPSLGIQPAPSNNTQRAARLASGSPIFSRKSLAGF